MICIRDLLLRPWIWIWTFKKAWTWSVSQDNTVTVYCIILSYEISAGSLGKPQKGFFLGTRPLRGGGGKGLATKKKYLFLKLEKGKI